jgi:hypothetical protein
MVNKPKRSHKSKAEQKRLNKTRKVKVVGNGRFVQRAKKPATQGKKTKSQLIRVDADFANWCRRKAEQTDDGKGSITEVTRKLYHKIVEAEATMLGNAAVQP